METGRKPLLVSVWLTTSALFAYLAWKVAPVGVYDDPAYQGWYWSGVALVTTALLTAGRAIFGAQSIRVAIFAIVRMARWPRAATTAETVTATTVIVACLGAIPHIHYMLYGRGGGTPPFSKIQADVMAFAFGPFLERMSKPLAEARRPSSGP